MFTVHEIFAWQCYQASDALRVFVDFGANIGLSSLYFLTRNEFAHGYLFEPAPISVARAESNLVAYRDRIKIQACAIDDRSGPVQFHMEETGRYSGIDAEYAETITVQSMNVNDALESVIQDHGFIDLLKIDVEGAEQRILPRIHGALLSAIGTIYVECASLDSANLLSNGFERVRHIAGVWKFRNARYSAASARNKRGGLHGL